MSVCLCELFKMLDYVCIAGIRSSCQMRFYEGQSNFVNSMGSHNVHTHWMYQYYGFGLMTAQWAETCRRIFNFLILITNICCVIDEVSLLYYRKTQRDGSYQSLCNVDKIQTVVYSVYSWASTSRLPNSLVPNVVNSVSVENVAMLTQQYVLLL